MTLDNAAFNAAFKEHYEPLRIKDMVYKDAPLFAMMPKGENFGGRNLPVPLKFGNPQGRSKTFATAQANKGNSQLRQFLLTRIKDYSLASIDNETLYASQGSADAFIEASSLEIDGAFDSIARSIAIDCYRTGTGSRGVAGTYVGATLVFTLSNVEDVTNFEVGQELVASAADGGALRVGSATITAIDRSAGTITTDSAWDAQITGFTANDFLYMEGDAANAGSNLGMAGLESWIPLVAPTGGDNHFGVDRSVDVTRLSGQRFDGRTTPLEEALLDAAGLCAREGGRPDYVAMNHNRYVQLEKSLGAKVEYNRMPAQDVNGGMANVGFEGIKITGPKGPVTVIPDHNCPDDVAWMLQMDTWKFYSLGMAPRLLDSDGNRLLREGNADAVEVRIGYYGQMSCCAPGWNCRIRLA